MDIKDFQLLPYTQRHYAPFDPDDPNTPFVKAISLDTIEEEEEEEEGLEIGTYDKLKKKRTSSGRRKSLFLFY
ncbi:MAG: hypothetical protein GEU26_19100 [Nitrososphaeraceae archaeon]|nr:hypothetical protein [Nitrososphaeraceae archaeon]